MPIKEPFIGKNAAGAQILAKTLRKFIAEMLAHAHFSST